MSRLRVFNKKTGTTDTIDWADESRDPTPDEIKEILSGNRISVPEIKLDPDQMSGYGPEVKAPVEKPIDFNKDVTGGQRASVAQFIYGGGDLIRRALGMERIYDKPEVQEAMKAPESWAGTAGKISGDIGLTAVPGMGISGAGRAAGLGLAGRLGLEAAAGGSIAGVQSAGDPYETAKGAALGGILGEGLPWAVGKAAPGFRRWWGGPPKTMTNQEGADVLLGRYPKSEYEAQNILVGPGETRASASAADELLGARPRGMNENEAASVIIGRGQTQGESEATDLLLGRAAQQVPPTPPRPMQPWEAEDTLLGARPISDTPLQSPWVPPTMRPERQLPQVASSTGARFLGGERGAPIDISAPVPKSAEIQQLAGSGQTEAAAKLASRNRPLRGPAGRLRKTSPDEALAAPSQEGAPPFVDLPPEQQAPYRDLFLQGETIQPPPMPAGLTDSQYMDWLRNNRPRTVFPEASSRTAATGVPTREYVGQPDIPAPGAPPAPARPTGPVDFESAVSAAERGEPPVSAPPFMRPGGEPLPDIPAPNRGPVGPPSDRMPPGFEEPTVAPQKSPEVRRLENEFGRELSDAELRALGETPPARTTEVPRPLDLSKVKITPAEIAELRAIENLPVEEQVPAFQRFTDRVNDRIRSSQSVDDITKKALANTPSTPPDVPAPGEPRSTPFGRLFREGNKEKGEVSGGLARWAGHKAGGGLLGGATGYYSGDTPEEKRRNALIGAAIGTVFAKPRKIPATELRATLNPLHAAGRQRLKSEALDVLNIPRTIMASADVSAPLRQGITMIHKPEFWKNLPGMIKSMASEEGFQASQKAIMARPSYQKMRELGLALSDMPKDPKDIKIGEELFMSKIAERIPAIGRIVRSSGRGYVGFLNNLRADVFDSLMKAAPQGVDEKALVNFINSATGRGPLPNSLERAAGILNATMFSPRLAASRVDLMTRMFRPSTYSKLDPYVRKEYIKSLSGFLGAMATVQGLGYLAGAELEGDPRSSDFNKLKFGKTRLDFGAGFNQYARAISQIVGGRKDVKSGRIDNLWDEKGQATPLDIVGNFARSKASPLLGSAINVASRRTFAGEKTQVLPKKATTKEFLRSEVGRMLTPMIMQDVNEIMEEDPSQLPMAIPALFGAGLDVQQSRYRRRRQ